MAEVIFPNDNYEASIKYINSIDIHSAGSVYGLPAPSLPPPYYTTSKELDILLYQTVSTLGAQLVKFIDVQPGSTTSYKCIDMEEVIKKVTVGVGDIKYRSDRHKQMIKDKEVDVEGLDTSNLYNDDLYPITILLCPLLVLTKESSINYGSPVYKYILKFKGFKGDPTKPFFYYF